MGAENPTCIAEHAVFISEEMNTVLQQSGAICKFLESLHIAPSLGG